MAKENHMGFMSKLLSFGSDKDLKRYYKIVDQINGLEPQFEDDRGGASRPDR